MKEYRQTVDSGNGWYIDYVKDTEHGESWYELFRDGIYITDGNTIQELKERL